MQLQLTLRQAPAKKIAFPLVNKFMEKIKDISQDMGFTIATIALNELKAGKADHRPTKEAKFDIIMEDGCAMNVSARAYYWEDALLNAFDKCRQRLIRR